MGPPSTTTPTNTSTTKRHHRTNSNGWFLLSASLALLELALTQEKKGRRRRRSRKKPKEMGVGVGVSLHWSRGFTQTPDSEARCPPSQAPRFHFHARSYSTPPSPWSEFGLRLVGYPRLVAQTRNRNKMPHFLSFWKETYIQGYFCPHTCHQCNAEQARQGRARRQGGKEAAQLRITGGARQVGL